MKPSHAQHLAILSLCLMPLLWLWPCVFGGRTFVPYDLAQFPPVSLTLSPDQLAQARDGANFDVTEVPVWFVPEMKLAGVELCAGRLPTWDPHARGGSVLHAHGLIGLCYPPNWLALFANDPASRLVFLAWISLALGGLLAFGLLRALGIGVLAAWFGALTFELCGPVAANAFFWMRLASFVWLPGVLWAVLVVARAERLRARHVGALAGSFAMAWLGGFPPFAASTTVLGCAFAAWLVVTHARAHGLTAARAPALRLLVGFVLGGLLAMPQVLPSLQFFPHSARPSVPEWVDIERSSFETYGLLGYLMPDAASHPTAQGELPYGQRNVLALVLSGRTEDGKPALPNFNYTEYAVFVGQLGLLLALLGAVAGRGAHRRFAIAAWLGCAGLALFVPGMRLLFHLPLVQNVWPMRWLAPATLFVAWLTALGLERLLASARRTPLAMAGTAALLAIVVLVTTKLPATSHAADRTAVVQQLAAKYSVSPEAVVGHVMPPGSVSPGVDLFERAFAQLAAEGARAAWWLAGASVWFLLLALLRDERQRRWLGVAAGAAAALQLGLHGATLTRGSACATSTDTTVHAFLRERAVEAAPTGGFTIVRASIEPGLPSQLPPGELMVPGVRDLYFYTHYDARSLLPLRTLLGPTWGERAAAKGYLTLSLPDELPTPAERAAAAAPGAAALPSYVCAHLLEHPLLDLLGVRYVLTTRTQPIDVRPEELQHAGTRVGPELRGPGGEFLIYERPHALPRAFTVPELAVLADDAAVVAALVDPDFAPARIAYTSATDLPQPTPGPTAIAPRSVRFVRDHPSDVELDIAAGDAPWLVLTDTWLPGWTATVDDVAAPIVRANYSQRAVRLPMRACRVRFVYTSPGLATGALLAALAATALLAFVLLRGRRGAATPSS